MSIHFKVEHRDLYSVLRVDGDPNLDGFLSFVENVGAASAGWAAVRLLVEMTAQ